MLDTVGNLPAWTERSSAGHHQPLLTLYTLKNYLQNGPPGAKCSQGNTVKASVILNYFPLYSF